MGKREGRQELAQVPPAGLTSASPPAGEQALQDRTVPRTARSPSAVSAGLHQGDWTRMAKEGDTLREAAHPSVLLSGGPGEDTGEPLLPPTLSD